MDLLVVFPYWLLFTFCAVGAVQYRSGEQRRIEGGPLLIAMAVVIALMIGLRFEVGGDWLTYVEIFQFARYQDFDDVISYGDPAYTALNWVLNRLGLGVWSVNLVCAIVFVWGLTKFVRRQPNPWLGLVVAVPYLIIVVAMGYTRQAVAIGLILAGLSYERQVISRFGLYILAAITFHKSAVVVLPLVALSATENRSLRVGLGAFLGLALYYSFVSAGMDRLVENYVTAQYDSQGAAVRVAMNLAPAALFLRYGRRFGLSEETRKLWRNFSLAAFASLALLLVISSTSAVDRLALYLIPLQVMVFSRLPTVFGKDGRANGLLTIAVIAYSGLVQFVWLNNATNASSWVPYKFMLF